MNWTWPRKSFISKEILTSSARNRNKMFTIWNNRWRTAILCWKICAINSNRARHRTSSSLRRWPPIRLISCKQYNYASMHRKDRLEKWPAILKINTVKYETWTGNSSFKQLQELIRLNLKKINSSTCRLESWCRSRIYSKHREGSCLVGSLSWIRIWPVNTQLSKGQFWK